MNEAKLDALYDHLINGGSLELKPLAKALSVTVRSGKTIERYLEAVAERDPNLDDLTIGGVNPYAKDQEEEVEDESEETPEPVSEEVSEPQPEPEKEIKTQEPAKKAAPKAKKKAAYRFFLEDDDGISVELERVESKSGGTVVTFKKKQITDMVTLMVKGEVIEVDIVALRKEKADSPTPYGITNDQLLRLALAAKP